LVRKHLPESLSLKLIPELALVCTIVGKLKGKNLTSYFSR
jgi:hypothetical protein